MGPGFPFGHDEMFGSQIEAMFVQHYECSKCHPIVHCNVIDFIFVTSQNMFMAWQNPDTHSSAQEWGAIFLSDGHRATC